MDTTYTDGHVCIMDEITPMPRYRNRQSRGCLGKGHEGRQDMRAWLSIDDDDNDLRGRPRQHAYIPV